MGLTNFTSGSDDDANNGSGTPPTGGMPPGFPPMPGMPSAGAADDDAVKELLINYNEKFKNASETLFRDAVIEQTISVIISKTKPNVLLVGAAGVGKTRIVEEIARRIALGDTIIPDQLKDHTIYELPITSVIAGSGIVGSLEEKMMAIVEFAANPKNKAIVFMDEIHQITGSSSQSDPIGRKISQILKPALARGDMSVIGATTSGESKAFDQDPAFARRFTRLIVDELSMQQTETILYTLRPSFVAHYRNQISISNEVLSEVVQIAETHARAGQHRPDNAITLLDRAMADRVLEQKRLIARAEAEGNTALVQALQAIPQVPLTVARVGDVARRLMTGNATRPKFDVGVLRATLLNRLRGQDDVLEKLADRLARQELEIYPSNTPTTWMLAGASGVGKTETAKIIAEQMTGAEPIILNMTEYHSEWSLSKIIGSPPGYVGSESNQEKPFDTLESNPHRVILLDEFEKADKAVQRLFLSAFDEGYIRDSHGKTLDFSKALVICTTNAAREALSGSTIGFGSGPKVLSTKSLNKALTEHFDAELLGRFSMIVGYNPINEEIFREIMDADYTAQRERILAAKPRLVGALPANMPDTELRAIAERAYVESQGARPAKKAVRTWIEDQLLAAQTAQFATQAAQVAQDAGAVVLEPDDTDGSHSNDTGDTPPTL